MTLQPTTDFNLAEAPFTWKTLTAIANTEFVPAGLRGKPAAILACVLTGRELGLGPMESLRHIDMIEGNPSPSAEWMLARVFDAGHVIYPETQTAESCTAVAKRMLGTEVLAEVRFTFTIEMARRAGLSQKNNWKAYPEAMLYWRAVAQVCRQSFPDLLRGLRHLPEELGSEEWMVEPPTTSEMLESKSSIEEADIEPATHFNNPITADEQTWSDLYAILAEESSTEPIKVLEARLRSLYELMGRVGIWVVKGDGLSDPLHIALRKHALADHVGDLKRNELVAFCKLSWEKAREAVRASERAAS